ncbi:MAG: MurR/RpiR family transcriptional regulator [Sporolactobacillus sp.]
MNSIINEDVVRELKDEQEINRLDDLWVRIGQAAQGSPTYEKLAHYIEKNYMQVVFMTASEVAVKTGISQGSVSRFCIGLGYKGYNDFLHNLQRFARKEITAPQRLQYTSNSDETISGILKMEHENMDQLLAILHQPGYQQLVASLVAAKHVVLVSARMSATLLSYTSYILNKIRNNVTCVTPQTSEWDTLELFDPKDVQVLAMVFPRYPKVLLEKLEELNQKGFSIAAITDSITSPAYRLASPALSVPITTSSIFDIYSTPILFLNLLLRDVARETSGLDKRLQEIEQMDRLHNIYYEAHRGFMK